MNKRQPGQHPGAVSQGSSASQIAELNGYCELGMKGEALRLARHFLKRTEIKPNEFDAALGVILIQADRLKAWRPLVESAYARLGDRGKRMVQRRMLGFYNSLYDWESACQFVPARQTSPLDLLMSMEAMLNLKKLDAAKPLVEKCWRMFDKTNDKFAMSALLEALARYYAQIGQLEIAEKCWQRSATIEDYAHNAITGLVEIEAVRGWLYVAAGLRQIQEFRKSGVDKNAIILPRNRGGLLNEAERHLKRYQRALEKIVPADELWRFGVNSAFD